MLADSFHYYNCFNIYSYQRFLRVLLFVFIRAAQPTLSFWTLMSHHQEGRYQGESLNHLAKKADPLVRTAEDCIFQIHHSLASLHQINHPSARL